MIKDENLIVKEFKYHEKFYANFTRGFSATFRSVDSSSSSSQTVCSNDDSAGDYGAVRTYINENVLTEKHALSMKELHKTYGLNVEDVRYRGKLKTRITKEFGNKITFLRPHGNLPDIVINNEILLTEVNFDNHDDCVIKAAEYLREDILQYSASLPELNWPSTVEEISSEEISLPPSVLKFLTRLLKSSDKDKIVRSDNVM